jgi:hypothetical protein
LAREIPANGPYGLTIQAQAQIGWLGMLQGYWTKKWQEAYEQSYEVPDKETWKQQNNCTLEMQR